MYDDKKSHIQFVNAHHQTIVNSSDLIVFQRLFSKIGGRRSKQEAGKDKLNYELFFDVYHNKELIFIIKIDLDSYRVLVNKETKKLCKSDLINISRLLNNNSIKQLITEKRRVRKKMVNRKP